MKKNNSNNIDIAKLLDRQHAKQVTENRVCFIEIIKMIGFRL